MGQGGDVFVLDMGEPIKIIELAKRMIHLSGLEIKDEEHPEGEIEISFTGLRPGEKLYEELLIGDNVSETAHCRIMRAEEEVIAWELLDEKIKQLNSSIEGDDFVRMREILKELVSGFVPQCEINDVLFNVDKMK
jgi:FlaA1/EpsC-like NDP-sugar epimerase